MKPTNPYQDSTPNRVELNKKLGRNLPSEKEERNIDFYFILVILLLERQTKFAFQSHSSTRSSRTSVTCELQVTETSRTIKYIIVMLCLCSVCVYICWYVDRSNFSLLIVFMSMGWSNSYPCKSLESPPITCCSAYRMIVAGYAAPRTSPIYEWSLWAKWNLRLLHDEADVWFGRVRCQSACILAPPAERQSPGCSTGSVSPCDSVDGSCCCCRWLGWQRVCGSRRCHQQNWP